MYRYLQLFRHWPIFRVGNYTQYDDELRNPKLKKTNANHNSSNNSSHNSNNKDNGVENIIVNNRRNNMYRISS